MSGTAQEGEGAMGGWQQRGGKMILRNYRARGLSY